MEQQIEEWFKELKRIWIEKDLQSIPNLLAEKFSYYESPFEAPQTTIQAVVKEWEIVREQVIDHLEIEILSVGDNKGTAAYTLILNEDGKLKISRGVYFVEVNNEGRAVIFRQWWMSR